MLKWIALIFGVAHAQVAVQSPSYVIFPSQTACLARSQQMCAAMGCDGVRTKYWWDCSTILKAGTIGPTAVAAGSFAMRVEASGRFGPTTSNSVSNGIQGLNSPEQSSAVSATAIAPLVNGTVSTAPLIQAVP